MNGNQTNPDQIRRRLVRTVLAAPIVLAVPKFIGLEACAAAATPVAALTPTPACDDGDDDPTESQTEGPYFKARSPQRTSLLESGVTGTELLLIGTVVTRSCRPVAGALIDFWQADDAGAYDNAGFRLRGHQFTGADGVYTLRTIVPGLYPGRTRHIHVKVQAPSRPVLTTQLYFPGEARNAGDGIYDADLLMRMADGEARFTFVLDIT